MKLVMTLLLRDEEDIVARNIEYHLHQGVDFIIATDNLSEDDTSAILRDYERLGVLHYLHQADDDYEQGCWVTAMARLAQHSFGADWVINNDADEFWCPEEGTLKQVLERVPVGTGAAAVKRVNFVPRRSMSSFADMTVRERQSLNALGEPLPPKVCHRAFADIEAGQGNHAVSRAGQPLPADRVPITILHFPLRSYGQFANKIIKGGAAYARNTRLAGMGGTWRYLYDLYSKGELERWWEKQLYDDARIEAGLADGTLVRDDRIQSFLAGRKRMNGSEL